MVDLSRNLFRESAKASYVNRHLYTPVLAILRMGLKELAPQLERPKGYKDSPTVQIPDKAWYRAVLPHMTVTTQALVSFLTMHGRRLGDGLGRKPADFKPDDGTLLIDRTKNGESNFVDLHRTVVDLMKAMPDWEKRTWLFGDGPTSGSNVRRDVLIACLKASGYSTEDAETISAKPSEHTGTILGLSVPYFSPHELGRHAFATRMLRAGFSLQYVKDAGGWKSIEVLSRLYGHLERKEWAAGAHKVADAFSDDISVFAGGKVEVTPPRLALASPANSN